MPEDNVIYYSLPLLALHPIGRAEVGAQRSQDLGWFGPQKHRFINKMYTKSFRNRRSIDCLDGLQEYC